MHYEDNVGGYNWRAGKSARAVAAEAFGLVTASELGRRYKVSATAVKHVLVPAEWHHTSKFYNATNYYDPDDVTPELVDEMREFDRRRKDETKPVVYADCTIEWTEWEGSRKHPRPVECRAEHVSVVKKGDWIVFEHEGRTLRKKLTGAYITLTCHDTPAVAGPDAQPGGERPQAVL